MGSNLVELAETYLSLESELDRVTGHEADAIVAKMDGMVYVYEALMYPRTFDNLLKDFAYYNR